MENNEVLEAVEDAIEADAIIVNYNVPAPTTKETLINTAIGTGAALVCVGVIVGVGKLIDVAGDALYKRQLKKQRERNERRDNLATDQNTESNNE